MRISRNYNGISENEQKLIDKGYGVITVHSIHFDRCYSKEQKEKNMRRALGMSDSEWALHCTKISQLLEVSMKGILSRLMEKYDIHQVSEKTSTMEHYRSNWDLFFYSNQGWNGKEYMDCFSLTFNKNRNPEQNIKLLEEIVALVEAIETENIYCRVQYDAVIDDKKVEEEASAMCECFAGRFITYCGMLGKIKVVKELNGVKEYGFFKKNAKNKYYHITSMDVLAMSM